MSCYINEPLLPNVMRCYLSMAANCGRACLMLHHIALSIITISHQSTEEKTDGFSAETGMETGIFGSAGG